MNWFRVLFPGLALLAFASGFGRTAEGEAPARARRLKALAGVDGRLRLLEGARRLGTLGPGLFEKGWKSGRLLADFGKAPAQPGRHTFRIKTPSGALLRGTVSFKSTPDAHGVKAAYTFTPERDVELNSLHVSAEFAVGTLAGGRWRAGEKSGLFPAQFKDVHLFNAPVKSLRLDLPEGGGVLSWSFARPTAVLIQDNRKWGPSFSIRIGAGGGEGPQGMLYRAKRSVGVAFTLRSPPGMKLMQDGPVTITAGADWVPLKLELDIEPGSALDFSTQGWTEAPAGRRGRVIARPDGQFAFEQDPKTPRRFYGVNFCFSANYITHEQSDRLAERLRRLGYNAVRIHHYEGELVRGQPDTTTFNKEKLDQLDYLLAALAKRGLYITTDLYVSRPVKQAELGRAAGRRGANNFKLLVPVHEGAWKNWKAFARKLLTHRNPYTKKRYAEDPALAWISMINEGNFGNYYRDLKTMPEWIRAWNAWLAKRYDGRAGLAKAWGGGGGGGDALQAKEDPKQGSVALPGNLGGADARARDAAVFLAATESGIFARMKKFLREELGCRALLTNTNGWTNFVTDQRPRALYDYVDDHFYIDHPRFLERPWRLPSRSPNSSPISGGARGGRDRAFTRLFGKPFTISEYNYSCPGRFRGVGGILTGALGALQGWGAIWRFAYSHNRESLFAPRRMDYFNMASDPLGQAAERAALCLFLRGDMKTAPHRVAVAMSEADLDAPPRAVPRLAPPWHWMAWITRVGLRVLAEPKTKLDYSAVLPLAWKTPANVYTHAPVAKDLDPYGANDAKLLALLKAKGLPEKNRSDPQRNILESETGELLIDGQRNVMILNTPRTAGGFAPAGQAFEAERGGVSVRIEGCDATVWVSALDGKPITASKRLLVTHLTDLQNTEIRYAEQARQTLLDWGRLPHLVRAGRAFVRVKLDGASRAKVWALAASGRRLGRVKAAAKDGMLRFTADVAGGGKEDGARMLYEIAVK